MSSSIGIMIPNIGKKCSKPPTSKWLWISWFLLKKDIYWQLVKPKAIYSNPAKCWINWFKPTLFLKDTYLYDFGWLWWLMDFSTCPYSCLKSSKKTFHILDQISTISSTFMCSTCWWHVNVKHPFKGPALGVFGPGSAVLPFAGPLTPNQGVFWFYSISGGMLSTCWTPRTSWTKEPLPFLEGSQGYHVPAAFQDATVVPRSTAWCSRRIGGWWYRNCERHSAR